MKRHPFQLVFLFFAAFAIVACQTLFAVSPQPQTPPLQFAYNLWPGYFPIEIADEKGFFAEQGVNVELIFSESYSTILSNIGTGNYQGFTTTLGGVMSLVGHNDDFKIVLVSDRSAGADALLVNSKIKEVADLKGKRIGVLLGDFGELLVVEVLAKHNLSSDDVIFVNADGGDINSYITTGKIDAGVTWQPYISEGLNLGHQVLLSTKDMPGLMPGVIAFRNSVIRDRPQDIQAFIRAWFQAQDYWQKHPEESQEIIARRLGISLEDVSTEGIELASLPVNQQLLTPNSSNDSLYSIMQVYIDFSIRKGILGIVPTIENFIDSQFIQNEFSTLEQDAKS
ncbi:ABC transporter substrate-binding protein [Oscillatoria amoena NRMC-F 0135]|nr:ABC transporter substrate-binding protein [Oscillatoria amoena NRMC-F 0135]